MASFRMCVNFHSFHRYLRRIRARAFSRRLVILALIVCLVISYLRFLNRNAYRRGAIGRYRRARMKDFEPPARDNTVNALTIEQEKKYLALPDNLVYTQNVAIITIVRNDIDKLSVFAQSIRDLTYPRQLISVYFADDGSSDGTLELAKAIAEEFVIKDGFRFATVKELHLIGGKTVDSDVGHDVSNQRRYRGHVAQIRNAMMAAISPREEWTLWLDIGVTKLSFDLIEQFMYVGKDVMAATCLLKGDGGVNVIRDLNTWQETEESLDILDHLGSDGLMLEGYGTFYRSYRTYLPHLRPHGRVVPVDGVGGCVLMVRGTCFKNGLKFPEEVYKNHIDTEGFAKLATDMGYGVYGLPYLEVFQ